MSVRRNTIINMAGGVAPVLISLATIPLYLHKIGDARYGVLAIVWLLVSYFGLFDLGLPRAIANQMAKLQTEPAEQRERTFWTALALNGSLGVIGGAALYGVLHLAFGAVFRVPSTLKPELFPTLPWIALTIPIAAMSGTLTGSLEGLSRFGPLNAIQVGGTILTQAVPLSVAYLHGPSLAWLVPSVVLARLISVIPLAWVAARLVPLFRPRRPSREKIRALLSYGTSVTVSNAVMMLLDVADRLLIGAILGAKSVTYYTVPYGFVSRLNVVPESLSRSLFPLLSHEGHAEGSRLATQALRGLAAIVTPVIILGIFLMRPFLTVWVGASIANSCFGVGELILVGAWVNGICSVPFVQLQAQSRPQVMARFYLIEAVPYLALLWLGLRSFGIVGAAAVWSLGMFVKVVILFLAARYRWTLVRGLLPAFLLVLLSCVVALVPMLSILERWLAGGLLIAASMFWAFMYDSPARTQLADLLRAIRGHGRVY